MEKEILIEINEWNSGQTFLSIHEFNFHKEFKCRKDRVSGKAIRKEYKKKNCELEAGQTQLQMNLFQQ